MAANRAPPRRPRCR